MTLATSLGTPGAPRPGRGRKNPLLEAVEAAGLCQPLDFELLASRTTREQIPLGLNPRFVAFCYGHAGTLTQQRHKT